MAGGNPLELVSFAGVNTPRYKLVLYLFGSYIGAYYAFSTINSFKPKPLPKFESKEEEAYVSKYIAHAKEESHKPELLRTRYAGPSN